MSDRLKALEGPGTWGLLLLFGGLVVFLSFNGGGFFPGAPGAVAVILIAALATRIVLAPHPFAGFSPALAVAVGALGLYTVWTGLSAVWSDSVWRAMIEFDRALLYLVALVLFGSIPRDSQRMRWMTRILAVVILQVCTVGLISRLFPDAWTIAPNLDPSRLSYPLTYWNTLGLMAAIGTILCFHFASSRSEPRPLRVAGAGAVPILAATLFFTFSRGAILALAIGLMTYMVIGRPRALLSGLVATVPAAATAVAFSYQADKLASPDPTGPVAVSQGHDLALWIGLCVVAAIGVRLLLLTLDARMDSLRLPDRARLPVLASLAVGLVAASAALTVVLDLPGYVSDQYEQFVHGSGAGDPSDARTRLVDPSNSGRLDYWRVAIDDGFNPSTLHGRGAGTFELVWIKDRPRELTGMTVHDAHSVYVESLSDLGLIGFLLVLIFVVTILYGFAARLAGRDRTLYAALFAAGLAWALHAGVDWDWEMPAVTLWVFALGGAALAAPPSESRRGVSPPLALRAAMAAALVLIGVVPALATISQMKLDDAVETFLRSGDCPQVIEEARSASSVLSLRPEPYRLEGYCQARLGDARQAVASMQKALERDPDNWEYQYSLAVAQAAAGENPRPAAREALRLDPLGAASRDLVKRFRSANPSILREHAATLLRTPVF